MTVLRVPDRGVHCRARAPGHAALSCLSVQSLGRAGCGDRSQAPVHCVAGRDLPLRRCAHGVDREQRRWGGGFPADLGPRELLLAAAAAPTPGRGCAVPGDDRRFGSPVAAQVRHHLDDGELPRCVDRQCRDRQLPALGAARSTLQDCLRGGADPGDRRRAVAHRHPAGSTAVGGGWSGGLLSPA